MKSSFLPRPLRQAALLGLAAAALLCAGGASAQTQPLAFQVTNLTFSGGGPLFPVTDDLTFNNLLLTENFSDGTMATLTLNDPNGAAQTTLDSGPTDLISNGFSFVDGTGRILSSATLTGTLGISGFPATPILAVDVETAPVDPTQIRPSNTFLNAAFSSTLTFPAGAGMQTPGGIGVGQFGLVANNAGTNFPAILLPATIYATTNPVPEASTVLSMGLMLALGLGGLAVTRRRRTAE